MPTFRALLIAQPELGEAARRALVLVRAALARFGFVDVVSLPRHDQGLFREQVHAELDALSERAGPEDACLVYYFGHGGRVVFEGLQGPHAHRVFTFLHSDRSKEQFDALLDLPLRNRFARLARSCDNLTVVVDACHSGKLVRTALHRQRTPPWLSQELATYDRREAPPIVCLAAAPPLSEAGTNRETGVGWLTEHFCSELSTIAARGLQVSWEALAHRLRGRIITTSCYEQHWLVASGPCERRLFTSEIHSDGYAVGFVVAAEQAWLRIGSLQGSSIGDRWALLDLDERVLARGRVSDVDPNRSKLVLDEPLPAGSPCEGHARLLRATRPNRLELDPSLHEACMARVSGSAWLSLDEGRVTARLELRDGALVATDLDGRWPTTGWPLKQLDAALGLLEDQARSRRLLAIPSTPSLFHIEGVPTQLRTGDPLELRLSCPVGNSDSHFAALVMIDPVGRPWRLAPEQPEGIELNRDRVQSLRFDVALSWPEDIEADSLPCTLLAIMADRPLQLAHLTSPHPEQVEGLSLGLAVHEPRMRCKPRPEPRTPLPARLAGVQKFQFQLHRETP